MNDRTFCDAVNDITSRLDALISLSGGSKSATGTVNNELLIQHPESTDMLYLNPGEVYERTIIVKKWLKKLDYSISSDCLMTVEFDNDSRYWFNMMSGSIEYSRYVETLKIRCENLSDEPAPWSAWFTFRA